MIYKFGYDISYDKKNKEKPFSIGNGFIMIEGKDYDELMKITTLQNEEPEIYLKNNDHLYFTEDTKSFPSYKLEKYCTDKKIIISTMKKAEDCDIIVANINNSLSPILYTSRIKVSKYPIKLLRPYINDKSLKDAEATDDDFIIMSGDFANGVNAYVAKEYLEESDVCFNYLFSKKEVKEQIDDFEPFTSLVKAVKLKKRIIDYKNFEIEMHRNSPIIDDEFYETILGMFKSPDQENIKLAINLITDADREKSLSYLIILYYKFNELFDNKTNNNIEFINFINEIISMDLSEKNIIKVLLNQGLSKTKIDKYLK